MATVSSPGGAGAETACAAPEIVTHGELAEALRIC
jgi:hypothetical protein